MEAREFETNSKTETQIDSSDNCEIDSNKLKLDNDNSIDKPNISGNEEHNSNKRENDNKAEANSQDIQSTEININPECERLLRNTKKQIKQIMEEAVTRKIIHGDSSSVLSLCVAIDACLSHGLKRKALGLFNTSTSMALMHKVAKTCPSAQDILSSLEAEEAKLVESMQQSMKSQQSQFESSQQADKIKQTNGSLNSHAFQVYKRNLWIKLALIEDKLVDIVEYLAKHWSKFYEPGALMADHLCAQILCSLLVGPSALEFSRSKVSECHFEDPTAGELLRRHKLANPIACLCKKTNLFQYPSAAANIAEPDSLDANRRRPLALKKNPNRATLLTDCHHYSCQEISEHEKTRGYSLRPICHSPLSAPGGTMNSSSASGNLMQVGAASNNSTDHQACCDNEAWPLWSPRMLHEILHQNSRFRLLYAKNNVLLETATHQLIPGYLSLHQTSSDLILKWIPNQMINGTQSKQDTSQSSESQQDKSKLSEDPTPVESSYLDLVVSVPVSHIVLLHCQLRRGTLDICGQESQFYEDFDGLEGQRASSPGASRSESPMGDVNEETLILVETDGVQRAPFRFPKGGLRLFLSCLQNGLGPDRYLDPAIKFDDTEWPPQSFVACSNNDGTSAVTDSQEIASVGLAKLDNLLKRLPSLKKSPRSAKPTVRLESVDSTQSSGSTSQQQQTTSPIISAQNSANATRGRESPVAQNSNNNFVYRIVAVKQPGWPLPTPPDTALSVSSSASCSNGQPNGRLERRESQRSRWNLGRWAGFRRTTSTSGGSTSSQQTFTETFDQTTATTTTDNTSTASIDQHDPYQIRPPMDDASSRNLARVEAKLYDLKKSTSDEVLETFRTHSIQTLCDSMRRQILARAFYGWLAYCRRMKVIRQHLSHLVNAQDYLCKPKAEPRVYAELARGLTESQWNGIIDLAANGTGNHDQLMTRVHQLVYYGGVENENLRRKVWPYLLGLYQLSDTKEQIESKIEASRRAYESCNSDWLKVERVVRQRDSEILAANMAKVRRNKHKDLNRSTDPKSAEVENHDNASSVDDSEANEMADTGESSLESANQIVEENSLSDVNEDKTSDRAAEKDQQTGSQQQQQQQQQPQPQSADIQTTSNPKRKNKSRRKRRWRLESTGSVCSDASITDQFGNNIHRIDKDVQRCDRNFWYFRDKEHLDKLRNIMCTYVWQHLDVGYVQGMCDLAAPFLVIFDEELLAFNCFSELMKRMVSNFPHGSAMDKHFEALRYLMQVLDPKLFEILQGDGDYPYFYFCYRWLLLDFKRELVYDDVYLVWETIWSARVVVSEHFVVFIALAMVRYYREIMIENNMDFTDTIKFFNEMAEKHEARRILELARDSIVELQAATKD